MITTTVQESKKIEGPKEFVENYIDVGLIGTKCRYGALHLHLDTFIDYANIVDSITECVIDSCDSTWAFVKGLRDTEVIEYRRKPKKLVTISKVMPPRWEYIAIACPRFDIDYTLKLGNDIYIQPEETDLLFIDTWHVYGHLRRELEHFHPYVKRYIIMHDTDVDAVLGESIRMKHDIECLSIISGYPIEEIKRGILPAIEEFLASHSTEWKMLSHTIEGYGLTILERISL